VNAEHRARFLINPHARRAPQQTRLNAGVDWLRGQGWFVDVQATEQPGELCRLAEQAAAQRYDCVVACGGDGTLNGALNGVVGTQTALAMVPAGTANVWAGEASLPQDPLAACRLVAEGARRRLDTGTVAGRSFLLMASTGLDSLVAEQVDWRLKKRLGRFAYFGRGIIELLRFEGFDAELTIDGEPLQTVILGLIAGNTRSYGGMIEIARDARADDGVLDVCLFQGRGRRRFIRHLVDLSRGRHTQSEEVQYRRAHRIELKTDRPWPVQADGEVVGHTPVSIECVPRSVTVVVPTGKHSPLWHEPEAE